VGAFVAESIETAAELAELEGFARRAGQDTPSQPDLTLAQESIAASKFAEPSASGGQSEFVERRKAPIADRRRSSVTERRHSPAKPAASCESSSIRIAIDKVDRLIDLVGELVIAHVMIARITWPWFAKGWNMPSMSIAANP
jgi:chemotaxis protein histidine kinase CheA